MYYDNEQSFMAHITIIASLVGSDVHSRDYLARVVAIVWTCAYSAQFVDMADSKQLSHIRLFPQICAFLAQVVVLFLFLNDWATFGSFAQPVPIRPKLWF